MQKENLKSKQANNPFPKMEQEILNFWDRAKIFEKSVKKKAPKGDYVFYDGPPFGTGEPHYGHLLSSISKDVVPRYWTMQGYRVERRWGWDCHGLPIENIIEQNKKISGKKEIEKMGVDCFNEACRAKVLEYADIWDKMIHRIGRWVEFKNSYKTMDLDYMESVWWGFSQLWEKDLIYQGRKVLLYCPRCETPISNFEVAMDNSYQEIAETSVYVKFKVKNSEKINNNLKGQDVYVLAWTTTPWTLPGNVALAIGKDIAYSMIKINNEYYILAKDRLEVIKQEYELVKEFKGEELIGLNYEPLFDVPALRVSGKKVYYIAPADFVTTEDGTGVVHIAVVYGEDDYNLGLKLALPVIPALDEKGYFNNTVPQFQGIYFKDADKKIIEDLKKQRLLFNQVDYKHPYPFCHRCETQLFYNAIPAWFLNIEKIRKRMLELNKNINWFPKHLKQGRFAQGIEQAPDWNISRNRYFATPMPIWECDKCKEREVIGSVKELEDKSGKNNIKDIHNHFIDDLKWKCLKCDGDMKRISEVFDCWVESGSMFFAQMHYPFENKEKFEKNFPAQFISEYISQTRAWFYVMHVLSTALFDSNSFENVVTTGVIFTEDGSKMSKSKKNFPDPWKVINEFGVDSLRCYLMSSTLMHAENLFFNERELRDVFRKNIMLVWNVYKFFELFTPSPVHSPAVAGEGSLSENILDKWITARLNQLIETVTKNMDEYNIPKAIRPIEEFINDLSTWYLRRSRGRFKGEDEKDKQAALQTTGYVLLELSKVMAPFTPFIAEQIWQRVSGNDFKDEDRSVHLESWPKLGMIDENILNIMKSARIATRLGLSARDLANIKARQPLKLMYIDIKGLTFEDDNEAESEIFELIKEEINVKKLKKIADSSEKAISRKRTGVIKVKWADGREEKHSTDKDGSNFVSLVIDLTAELKQAGIKRELVRFINNLRKQAGMTIQDEAHIFWQTDDKDIKKTIKKYKKNIMKDTLASDMEERTSDEIDLSKEVKVNGIEVWLGIKKI